LKDHLKNFSASSVAITSTFFEDHLTKSLSTTTLQSTISVSAVARCEVWQK